MAALFFSSGIRTAENQVREILSELGERIEVFRSVNSLSRRFGRPRGDIDLLILNIANHNLLNELVLLKDQMYDLPIILILPDTKRETVLAGHRFYPRFISDARSGFGTLSSVLERMFNRRKNEWFSIGASIVRQREKRHLMEGGESNE